MFGFKGKTAAESIKAAGGKVDVGRKGRKGASIVVTDGKGARSTIAGKKVKKIQGPDFSKGVGRRKPAKKAAPKGSKKTNGK